MNWFVEVAFCVGRQTALSPIANAQLEYEGNFQVFRKLWQIRTAWLLYKHYNAPKGDANRASFRQSYNYACSLSEMLDEPGEDYISPNEAISIDRQYWCN